MLEGLGLAPADPAAARVGAGQGVERRGLPLEAPSEGHR